MRVDTKPVAVYEKAFPESLSLSGKIEEAARIGFSAIEIAIDDDPDRRSRLSWGKAEADAILKSLETDKVFIQSITLSLHRIIPMGSSNDERRDSAIAIARQAINLASNLQIEIVQIAGYFATAEDHYEHSRQRFIAALSTLAPLAEEKGIVLAVENVDGEDVLSAADGISIIQEVNSPAVRLYVDVGNYTANGLDAIAELKQALPYACAIQLKDSRPGEFRRVDFGTGDVPFAKLIEECIVDFATLPLSLEMWNDTTGSEPAEEAFQWFTNLWTEVSSYRWDQLQSDSHGHSH